MLGLDASLFASGDTSAAYLIWEIVRNFTNVVIVIILLVVVFSQLTGWGIDNYGIKRILPRLIAMAIMINLSYIICQVAVDVSNIVGKDLNTMMDNISKQVFDATKASGAYGLSDYLEVGFSGILTAIFGFAATGAAVGGVAASIVSVVAAATAGTSGLALAALIIPVALTILAAIVAVIIFFLLLSLRKLLAVVLVALSPLAFACYILPGTQKFFKKWFELFKAVLVVYPICGGLYGISKLMKVVAFTADGIHIGMMMVAMIFQFVPFFIAPSLIKKSIAAFGEFGNILSRIGNSARKGAGDGATMMRNSDLYKDSARTASIKRAERRRLNYKNAVDATRSGNATKRQRRIASSSWREHQNARDAQFVARSNAEDVEMARINMRGMTGNYDNDIMESQAAELLNRIDSGEKLSTSELYRLQAIMSQLSAQNGGAKKIYSLSKNRTGASAQVIGSYMAQNDKVRAALDGKHRWNSSRISDIASGAISENTTQSAYDAMDNGYLEYCRREVAAGRTAINQTEWLNRQYANYTSSGGTLSRADWNSQRITVAQNIANNVLDKDREFVTQTGEAVRQYSSLLSQDRINQMAASAQLFGTGDVAVGVREQIQNMASSTYIQDGTGTEVQIRRSRADASQFEIQDPTVAGGWRTIANTTGYTSKIEHDKSKATAPKILSHGNYRNILNGAVVHLREMDNGTFMDDSGTVISSSDIKSYRKV